MTKTLRFAVVGCGRMGRLHTERLHADGRAHVTAYYDANQQIAESLRDELAPDADLCPDLETLLATKPDAVIVCTPTSAHFDQTTRCLDAGLPVLCEKPLADTRERILTLVNSDGPLLSVAYQRRYWATYRTLRRELQSQRWGPLQMIMSHNVENWQQTIAGTWRDDPAINWGGFIGDAGSHKIDTVFYVTGLMPTEVFANCDRQGSNVEITASVSARLEGNVPLHIDFVGNASYWGEDLHIHCRDADLMIRERQLWITRDGEIQPLEPLEPESDPDVGFVELLTGVADNVAPPECALPIYDFTRAILESNRTGSVVALTGHI